MRRKIFLIISLFLLGGLFFLAPHLISVKVVRSNLLEQIGRIFAAEVAVEEVHWRWGPLPHLTLIDARVKNDHFEMNVPKTRIYPDWFALFARQVEIGRISLGSPVVKIDPSLFLRGGAPPLKIQALAVTVDNGTLELGSYTGPHLATRKIRLSEIFLKMRGGDSETSFSLESKASFASRISLTGRLFHDGGSYSATLKTEKFNLRHILSEAGGLVTPLRSEVDFGIDFIGEGDGTGQALFSGNLPDLAMQRLDDEAHFHFTKANFVLSKTKDALLWKVYDLALRDPKSSFSGEVEQSLPADSSEPRYRIDLTASDVDLGGVRAKLLTLLGDNHITRTVCNVVRSGRAATASYRFDGVLADFHYLKSMVINVEVDKAEIHVPDVELDLYQASGPIIMKDGNIYGHHLTTRMGNNYGSNGSFSLGLSEDNWLFTLDLDIDADLAELPAVLHHLIDDEDFRGEVEKFSAQGRAHGHLTMGDDLRDYTVDVRVADLSGAQLLYSRLSWPIELKGGSLRVTENEASWQGVSAVVGPHALTGLSGVTSWEAEHAPTAINALASAELEASSLLAELNRYRPLRDLFREALTGLDGRITLTDLTMHGPFFEPGSWEYHLAGQLDDLRVASPRLPADITVRTGSFSAQPAKIEFSDCESTLLGGDLLLSASLSHRYFLEWREGWLKVKGVVTKEQGKWIKDEDWLPSPFMPKFPADLTNFKLSWHGKDLSLFGSLAGRTMAGIPVEAVLEVNVADGRHTMTEIHFFNDRDDGKLRIAGDWRYSSPLFSWKGRINKQTIAALFPSQYILDGALEGNFEFSLPASRQGFTFSGQAEAENLQWIWGEYLRQITIEDLELKGNGEELVIDRLLFHYKNEEATTSGKVYPGPHDVKVDLLLQADNLSQQTLTHFTDDLGYYLEKLSTSEETENGFQERVNGHIEVQVNTFRLTPGRKDRDTTSYSLTPFQGTVNFSDPAATTLTLDDSQLCGLRINGLLRWQADSRFTQLSLQSAPEQNPLFEEVFPCLGYENNIIRGPFVLDATLTDDNGDYTGGSFSLHGEDGVLAKMVLLSKIFKLINFTDLYQGLFSSGFRYKLLDIEGHVEENLLVLDRAVIEGEGMDLLAQGNINLQNSQASLTIFIVPFKTIDAIINMVPVVGRIIGGKKRHIFTYPVRVSGDIRDPEVSMLSPSAIGKAAINYIFDTITFPLDLLPEPAGGDRNGEDQDQEKKQVGK